MPNKFEYVLIAGMGRSGTNYLLDVLDYSSVTICRNEPDEIPESSFYYLDNKFTTVPFGSDEFDKNWNESVAEAKKHYSIRDRAWGSNKIYQRFFWSKSFADFFLSGIRKRKLFSSIWPQLKGQQYQLPNFILDSTLLDQMLLVLKIIMKPGWIIHLLDKKPDIGVLHVVRHPCGYFNSMKSRYIDKIGEEKARTGVLQRLRNIAEEDPSWKKKFLQVGELDNMEMYELSVCWWWCFNETLYSYANNKKNYFFFLFEDLVNAPEASAQLIYEKVGIQDKKESMYRLNHHLKDNHVYKQKQNSYSDPSKGNVDKWMKGLSQHEVDRILFILEQSVFKECWN